MSNPYLLCPTFTYTCPPQMNVLMNNEIYQQSLINSKQNETPICLLCHNMILNGHGCNMGYGSFICQKCVTNISKPASFSISEGSPFKKVKLECINQNGGPLKPIPIRNVSSENRSEDIPVPQNGVFDIKTNTPKLDILLKAASEAPKNKKRNIVPKSQFLVCSTCSQTKPYKEFTTKRTGERTRTCKICSERKRTYYQRNICKKRRFDDDTYYY